MAEIIAIINQKGGSGKTTTAVNLGACLAELGKKVLLVDLDPQCNATIHTLGKKKTESLWVNAPSIYEVLTKGHHAEKAAVETEVQNLKLIPSHIRLSGADLELANVFCRERILRDQLKPPIFQRH